jgi:hypothetical protein
MTKTRLQHILMIALVAYFAQAANAQEGQFYPHGALSNAHFVEQLEAKKADTLEHEAIQRRDDYEREKREVERQISAYQFQVEQLKLRQLQAQEEIDLINVNAKHVRDQIAQTESDHKKVDQETQATVARLETQRSELESDQKKMEKALADLLESRKKAEREIFARGVEIQRMTTDRERLQTKTTAAEAKRAALESEEMKTRTAWMQTKMQLAEVQRQHDNAVAEMEESKIRWNQAKKELSDAKSDLARAQAQRDNVVAKVNTDVSRFEQEILAANKAKIAAEAEQIRLVSEAEKMKDYAGRIRDTRDTAIEQEADASGMVLRTKVAVETARTELNQNVEAADRATFESDKAQSRKRGIAAAQEAADLVASTRVFITTSKCKVYPEPNTSREPAGVIKQGKKVLGKDHGSGWIEVANGGGTPGFIDIKCGRYEH